MRAAIQTARAAARPTRSHQNVALCAVCLSRHAVAPSTSQSAVSASSLGSTTRARLFSSTAPPRAGFGSFFTRRDSPRSATGSGSPVSDFLSAIQSGDLSLLDQSYRAIVAAHPSPTPGEAPLSRDDIYDAMRLLSSRTSPAATALLKRLYVDYTRWGFKRGARHLSELLSHFNAIGRPREGFKWAQANIALMTPELWRILLRGMVQHEGDSELVDKIVHHLRESGPLQENDYTLLLRHLRFTLPPDAEERRIAILRDLRSEGRWMGWGSEAEMLRLHINLGNRVEAEEMLVKWDMDKSSNVAMWAAWIRFHMAYSDSGRLKRELRRMREKGIPVDELGVNHAVCAIIQEWYLSDGTAGGLTPAKVYAVIDEVGAELGCGVSDSVWIQVVQLVVERTGDLDLAMGVYAEAKAQGVPVDADLAATMISALCNGEVPQLASAMEVYADFMASSPRLTNHATRSRMTTIYLTLFRAMARSPPPALDTAIGNYVRDMRSLGMTLPPAQLVACLLDLISASPDHRAAFTIYAHFFAFDSRALVEPPSVSTTIFRAFTDLSTPSSAFAPAELALEIIRDRRQAGISAAPSLLTYLLHSYGVRARTSRKSSTDPLYRQTKLDNLHRSIQDIHDHLKLGALGTHADVPVLNALMDAYARVEAYASAFEVWDELVERRPREDKQRAKELYGPSISIILDCCGRSGQLARARRIWGWAKRFGFDSVKAWEGWVECLCRLGRIDEAVDLVCGQQPRDVVAEGVESKRTRQVPVSKEMARILLKFCWREKESFRSVPPRVQERFPEWWDELREVVQTKSIRERAAVTGRDEVDEGEDRAEEVGEAQVARSR